MMERDVKMERDMTEAAAKTVLIAVGDNGHERHVAPPANEINDFSDLRAGGKPIRPEIIDGGLREAREEAADFRNYIVWRLLYRKNSPESTQMLGVALGHVIAAYHLVSVVEESEKY